MAMPWDSALGLWGKAMDNNYELGTTQRVRKNLSDEAIQKLIYDAMSSDAGLAALASAENLAGGSKSSSKTLLAQDLMTKIIGELAAVTAETETTEDQAKTTKEGRFLSKTGDNLEKPSGIMGGAGAGALSDTVICTELRRQGLLSQRLYESVGAPWKQVPYFTWRGYHFWAAPIARKMRTSPLLTAFFEPIVISRYKLLSGDPDFHLLGRLTRLGEPICWILGFVLSHLAHFKGLKNGRVQSGT